MWQRLGLATVGLTAALSAYALNYDPAFNGNNPVKVTLNGNQPAHVDQVTASRDGSAFFASLESLQGQQRFSVQRFLANGTRDHAFKFDRRLHQEDGWHVNYQRVAEGTDGSVYLAREMARPNQADSLTRIYHLDAHGAWDTGFGNQGVLELAFVSNLWRDSFFVDTQNRLWLAGGDQGFSRAKVLRFLPNGQPDTAFATAGLLSLGYLASFGLAVSVDDQNRLLVMTQGDHSVGVYRFLNNGQADASFASNGALWFVDEAHSFPTPYAVTATSQGIWGFHQLDVRNAHNTQHGPLYRAFRLDTNGARVTAFGDQGIASAEGAGGNITGTVLPLNDGRFVLSSWTSIGSRTALYGADGRFINAIHQAYYGSASLIGAEQSVLLGVNYGHGGYIYKLLTTE